MLPRIDITLFQWLNGDLHHRWLDSVMVYITQFNHFQILAVLLVLGFFIFGKKYEKVTIVLLLMAVLLSDTLGSFLKHVFLRLRPEYMLDNVRLLIESAASYSFPSNHAANTVALATVLFARYPKKKIIAICGILITLLVSYSRIYVGVHYPSDILFGWIVGICSAGLTIQVLHNLDWKSGMNQKTIFGLKYFSLLMLFIILVTLFRLKYIQGSTFDLAAEEAQYWNWSRHLDWSYYSKGPMVAYLIYLFTKLGGNTVFAIRLGAVGISLILTYLTYCFAQQLFGSKRISFFSALVMNIIPLFSAGAVLMTTDTPLLLFWMLTIYLVYLAVAKDKSSYWYLAGVTFGLGLLSKYTMGIWIPVLLIFFIFAKKQRGWLKRKEPYLSLFVGLLVFSPVIYWNYTHSWISASHVLGLSKVSQGFSFSIRYFFEYIGSQIGIITPGIFAGLAYAWWKSWSSSPQNQGPADNFPSYQYLWCTSAPIFLLFLLKSIQGKVQANWAAPAYYTGLILAVAIFDKRYAEAGSPQQKKRIAIFGWGSIFISAMLILLLHNPEYLVKLHIPLKAKYDITNRLRGWQELGNRVSNLQEAMSSETPRTPIFIFSDSYQIASELAFYVSGQPDTYCINLGRRMNQYDIWNGWDKLIEQNAIYVTDSRTELNKTITTSFTRCEFAQKIPIYLYREIIREYNIYKCYNFRGITTESISDY
jgi:undecaprenyl-diphosphatase